MTFMGNQYITKKSYLCPLQNKQNYSQWTADIPCADIPCVRSFQSVEVFSCTLSSHFYFDSKYCKISHNDTLTKDNPICQIQNYYLSVRLEMSLGCITVQNINAVLNSAASLVQG